MNITWHGQTCFKIVAQRGKDGSVNVLIDPFEKEVGIKPPRLDADVVLFTDPQKTISTSALLINGPGEYEVKGMDINGISAQTKNTTNKEGAAKTTVYTLEEEGLKVCHLGMLGQKELKSEQLERIGAIDILMIPIGGLQALEAEEAIKIMSQIEPKIILPMYYKIPGLKERVDGLDKFLKVLGLKTLEHLPKLSIKKKDISEEEAKIIVLDSA